MKYFIDFEFHEYTRKTGLFGLGRKVDTIEPISVGIVAEDGRQYYAIFNDFDIKAAWDNEWLRENVLVPISQEKMSSRIIWLELMKYAAIESTFRVAGKSREQIAQEIKEFVGEKPEFWGYYADYDWVVMCWLYGRMIQLPEGWPMFCRDLKQLLDEVVSEKYDDYWGASMAREDRVKVLKEVAGPDGGHNALADAKWIKSMHKQVMEVRRVKV
jgi:hypothetical protein